VVPSSVQTSKLATPTSTSRTRSSSISPAIHQTLVALAPHTHHSAWVIGAPWCHQAWQGHALAGAEPAAREEVRRRSTTLPEETTLMVETGCMSLDTTVDRTNQVLSSPPNRPC
jgi:hypothetical protein